MFMCSLQFWLNFKWHDELWFNYCAWKIMQHKTMGKQYTSRIIEYESGANMPLPVSCVIQFNICLLVRVPCKCKEWMKKNVNENLHCAECSIVQNPVLWQISLTLCSSVGWKSREPILNAMKLCTLTLKWWPDFGLGWCVEMIHTQNGDYGIDHIAKNVKHADELKLIVGKSE